MSALFNILDGIISSDYSEETLADASQVIDYAEAAGHEISYSEAERIIEAGRKWINDVENGNGEWSRMRHEAQEALEA